MTTIIYPQTVADVTAALRNADGWTSQDVLLESLSRTERQEAETAIRILYLAGIIRRRDGEDDTTECQWIR